ncbi:hypothetical protein LWI28_016075 [Acer negundo]|uniref:Uncharacterized protein n=1 Tax=Acer negundo TaxID=4023 RepID=A0AAD5IR10_ACENE|nr:hypothetical protein LWI28_016075 [Acer negundo]
MALFLYPDHEGLINARINSKSRHHCDILGDIDKVLGKLHISEEFKQGPFGHYLCLHLPVTIHGKVLHSILKSLTLHYLKTAIHKNHKKLQPSKEANKNESASTTIESVVDGEGKQESQDTGPFKGNAKNRGRKKNKGKPEPKPTITYNLSRFLLCFQRTLFLNNESPETSPKPNGMDDPDPKEVTYKSMCGMMTKELFDVLPKALNDVLPKVLPQALNDILPKVMPAFLDKAMHQNLYNVHGTASDSSNIKDKTEEVDNKDSEAVKPDGHAPKVNECADKKDKPEHAYKVDNKDA